MPDNDPRTIISPDQLFLTTTFQESEMEKVSQLFNDYIEIMGNSNADPSQWMDREDYILKLICKGLDRGNMKLSDIINQALTKGRLEAAAFQAEIEKGLKIT